MTSSRSTKNGKSKAVKHKVASEPTTARKSTRTVVYHPLSTPESREKWRKAIKAVLAREKSAEYKSN